MYAVLNMGYTPSQYLNLSQREIAFIIACIQIKLEEEKKLKAKSNTNKPRRRK
jgi:hypothetical protein